MAYTIGLTGNIACGKSTVGDRLQALGAVYIDTDRVVHEILAADSSETLGIIWQFGEGVRGVAGGIDRRALGAIVFGEPARLRALERILHPAVEAIVRRQIRGSDGRIVVVDGVKIVETGFADTLDELWVVTCSESAQRQRLASSRGMSAADIDARLAAQPNLTDKLRRADIVIDNSGVRELTVEQVDAAYRCTLSRAEAKLA